MGRQPPSRGVWGAGAPQSKAGCLVGGSPPGEEHQYIFFFAAEGLVRMGSVRSARSAFETIPYLESLPPPRPRSRPQAPTLGG